VSRLTCEGEEGLFIEPKLSTGTVRVRHEYIAADHLDSFRFLRVYERSYRTAAFGSSLDRHWTGPECSDAFVKGEAEGRAPLRAVVCVRALRRFEGLYSFSLMTATVDDGRQGLLTRVDVSGVSFDNGQRITRAFIDAIGRRP
jgi:hypothetical protein